MVPSPTPPHPASARLRQTSDIDEQSALLPGWNQNYSQLSGGAFRGALVEAHLPRAYFFREVTSHSLLQVGHLSEEMVAVGVPLGMRGPARFCGARCGGKQVHLFSGRDGFEFYTPEGLDIAVAVIPRSLLLSGLGEAAAARIKARLGRARLLSVGAEAFAGLRHFFAETLISDTALAAGVSSDRPVSDGQVAALTGDLAQQLRSCLLSEAPTGTMQPEGERAATAARRMSVISEVRDAVDGADPEEVLNIDLLCRRIGISRRTLQYAFEQELGLRPVAYMRALRLNKARRMIRQGAAVTEAATASGFWHFGRFSRDYRTLFGELPSSTLRGKAGDG